MTYVGCCAYARGFGEIGIAVGETYGNVTLEAKLGPLLDCVAELGLLFCIGGGATLRETEGGSSSWSWLYRVFVCWVCPNWGAVLGLEPCLGVLGSGTVELEILDGEGGER